MTEQEQKAFDQMREALEKSRAGIIAMRDHAEEYGKRWAACYVEAYRDMLPGSAKQQFDLLVELQKRIHPVADALISSYDAITAANAVSHPKTETTPAPEGVAITSESAANAVSEQPKPVALQWVAEMIMSDCGCSTNNDRLLERVIGRIEQYERANALANPQATEPAGWKLVPVEPTPEMLGCIVHSRYPEDWHAGKALQMNQRGVSRVPPKTEYEIAVGQYQRMLAAAPEAHHGK